MFHPVMGVAVENKTAQPVCLNLLILKIRVQDESRILLGQATEAFDYLQPLYDQKPNVEPKIFPTSSSLLIMAQRSRKERCRQPCGTFVSYEYTAFVTHPNLIMPT